jgi:hypothetical protein
LNLGDSLSFLITGVKVEPAPLAAETDAVEPFCGRENPWDRAISAKASLRLERLGLRHGHERFRVLRLGPVLRWCYGATEKEPRR